MIHKDDLAAKRVMITVATSGIGRNTTLALLKQGANVAFCGKSEVKMKGLLDEIAQMKIGIKKHDHEEQVCLQ